MKLPKVSQAANGLESANFCPSAMKSKAPESLPGLLLTLQLREVSAVTLLPLRSLSVSVNLSDVAFSLGRILRRRRT